MSVFRPSSLSRFGALALLIVAVAACEDEVTAPEEPELIEGQVTLDASSATQFVYFSLENEQLVQVADPNTSTDWDIGFRRFSVKLNGGVAGGGTVAGFNVGNNADATEEQITALTPADGQAAFDAVTEADIATATFVTDGLIPDAGASWFGFNPVAGTLVANPGAAWKVRTADGGFGLFRVSELNMQGQAPLGVTVEIRYQEAGGTLGDIQAVAIDFAQGPGFVDLSAGALGAPGGCGWDVSVTPRFTIDFNADCNAGSFPLDGAEDFTAVTSASDAPDYGGFLSAISGAIPNSVGDASGVFWYNIEGNNRLWPTYNVFLVQVGNAVYKVQITDYYSATGESGNPTLRYEQLR